MGNLSLDLFMTLDGVYQAPGGPDEDPGGGFRYGGWQAPYTDEAASSWIGGNIERMDALLLGRRTYDIFASHWPARGNDDPIAAKFNSLPKFVVSRSLSGPVWHGTTVLTSAGDVAEVKDRFADMHIVGSGSLARALLDADLVDRLNLLLYPLTFGTGKRLFAHDAGIPAAFRFVRPPRAFSTGAVALEYERAGPPVTGVTAGS
ncbi:dihydrofolate reductase family protein [Arthrobacter sp. ATA002]|uniref:dihydrofolate reductase family protein n=1 Tax=Arthrobacter sp. ATA002 TaxID=2991715 RepID=UPI0022A7C950|nr:dihydrofolate reductase family protein [Arthrobacter sp. ATA002]WAP50775.1 dihydrofolate reductase family protein [Arthrobacter sp. ATA002]